MHIRTFRDGDEAALSEVSNRSYTNKMALRRSEEEWKWRFRENPHFDPEGVIIAEENGEIVGYLIGTPMTVRLLNATIRFVIGTNLCVLLNYRGRGVAKAMIRELLEFAQKKSDLLLVYVEKGDISHNLVVKEFGWEEVGEITILIKILNLVRNLRFTLPILRSLVFSPQKFFHHLVRGVVHSRWRQDTYTNGYTTFSQEVRNAEGKDVQSIVDFINRSELGKLGYRPIDVGEYRWRYLTYKNSSLKSIILKEHEGRIDSHIAVSFHPFSLPHARDLINVATLNDVCGKAELPLRFAVRLTKRAGADVVLVHMSSENRLLYRSLGFYEFTSFVIAACRFSDVNLGNYINREWHIDLQDIIGEP